MAKKEENKSDLKEDIKSATENWQRHLDQRIRASYGGLLVRSFEEERTLAAIKEACSAKKKLPDGKESTVGMKKPRQVYVWDCSTGVDAQGQQTGTSIKVYGGTPQDPIVPVEGPADLIPKFASDAFPVETVLCVLDFQYFLTDPAGVGDVAIIRSMKSRLAQMKKDGKTVIFIAPSMKIPIELEKEIAMMDFPLPSKYELMERLEYILESASKNSPEKKVETTKELKERLCDAALGLTVQESEDLFSLTLAKNHKMDNNSIKTVIDGKCEVIKRDGILEYFTSDIDINDVGGLTELKQWLVKRVAVFTDEARDWGLPYPKGILLVGIQGCGKSLVAKMIANLYGVPLLRLDMGKLYQKYMGESEGLARRAILIAEAVAPVVLWIDEIEKGFSGTKSSGETDSGVTNRVIQTFLTWMQEKTAAVFIAATGNNVTQLPPELMRKGRMDEIFFVDLPNPEERKEIIKIQIRRRPKKIRSNGNYTELIRSLSEADLDKVVAASEGYTGSEIEQGVINALFDTYEERKEPNGDDIAKAIKDFVPLAQTMAEEIGPLRKWGENRAKNASAKGKYVPPADNKSPFRKVSL
jgi:SpoVK/Ycf46/Vps4 family AAA+-type ATPase